MLIPHMVEILKTQILILRCRILKPKADPGADVLNKF